jgi:hypothetical protein
MSQREPSEAKARNGQNTKVTKVAKETKITRRAGGRVILVFPLSAPPGPGRQRKGLQPGPGLPTGAPEPAGQAGKWRVTGASAAGLAGSGKASGGSSGFGRAEGAGCDGNGSAAGAGMGSEGARLFGDDGT